MISIITPSYNQGKYIERTIRSVLSQKISSLEFLVIDGGSQDETSDILKHYASYFAKMRFISEKDNGQAHAVNKGMQLSQGEIIGWLNSDDVYYPGVLNQIITFFATHPDVDVVYGKANYIDQHDKMISPYPTQNWNKKKLAQNCYICQPAVFFRRRCIENNNLLNEKLMYCLDYEFWLRLAKQGFQFHYLPEILAGSRLYPETKSCRAADQALDEALHMLHHHLGYVPINWLLHHSIVVLRKKTHLKIRSFSYIFFMIVQTGIDAFKWNGFLRGMFNCLGLPWAMFSRLFFSLRKSMN